MINKLIVSASKNTPGDFLIEFTFTSHNGFSINCQLGQQQSGNVASIIGIYRGNPENFLSARVTEASGRVGYRFAQRQYLYSDKLLINSMKDLEFQLSLMGYPRPYNASQFVNI